MQVGHATCVDDARGGSALRRTSRFNRPLIGISEEEAIKASVQNLRFYFCISGAESNLAPPSASVNHWYEKVSVLTPSGQSVRAVKKWSGPDAFEGIKTEDVAAIQKTIAKIDHNPPKESAWAADWGRTIAKVLGLDVKDKASLVRIKEILKHRIKGGCTFS